MSVSGIIVGKSFITMMVNGITHTINDQHPNYTKIREAVKTKDYDAAEQLVNIAKAVANYATGKITVSDGQVFYGNTEIKSVLVDRILDMMNEGFDAEPMIKFLENLMQNPSKRAVDELYLFLEQTSLPITEDGHFLAYKKVREDYMDYYTGTMDNSVGKIVEMLRNTVDDNRDNTCSQGLHFCSLSYLPHYHGNSGHVMIVKINPADVVSIPSDYNNAKGRTCRYEVIGEHMSENMEAFFTPVYTDSTDYNSDHSDDSDDWDNENEYEEDNDGFDDDDSVSPEDEAFDIGYEAGNYAASNNHPYDDSDHGYVSNSPLVKMYADGYSAGWNAAKLKDSLRKKH